MRESSTRFVLLGVLAVGGPLTGFQIRAFIDQSVRFFWRESFGQIYPELKKLAASSLITPVGSANEDGRGSQPWRITKAGRAVLKEWLDKPPQARTPRDELLLKVFLSRHGSAGTERALIANAQKGALQRLRGLQAAEALILSDPSDPEMVTSLIVLQRGLGAARAELDWCAKAEALLDAWELGGSDAVLKRWRNL